jgi:hypothetical protein
VSSGFEIAGDRYTWGGLEQITVRDQIRVERWLRGEGAEYTDARSWEDVLKIATEVNGLSTFAEQRKHPEFKLSLSLSIWAARRAAGEDVMPVDCMGFTWDQLYFWDDAPAGKDPAAP